jgi:hypothetical protein
MERTKRSAVVADPLQGMLDAGGGQLRNPPGPRQLDDARGPVVGQVGMLRGRSLPLEEGKPVGQMIGQGAGLVILQDPILRVDDPRPDLGGFGLGGGGHPLRLATVGTTLPLALDSIAIDESIEPVSTDLSERSHRSSPTCEWSPSDRDGIVAR